MNRTVPLSDRLQYLFETISDQGFLSKNGLGNEVPFFICPYPPEESNAMEMIQRQLVNQLEKSGVNVLAINLYDLAIELINERQDDMLTTLFEAEPEHDKSAMLELLQGVLDPQTHLAPAIVRKMQEKAFDVMFVSGIGEVFPFIRSHNLLNNLHSKAEEHPTVFFFPGRYTPVPENSSALALVLFERLKDDNHYRAFNIFERRA